MSRLARLVVATTTIAEATDAALHRAQHDLRTAEARRDTPPPASGTAAGLRSARHLTEGALVSHDRRFETLRRDVEALAHDARMAWRRVEQITALVDAERGRARRAAARRDANDLDDLVAARLAGARP